MTYQSGLFVFQGGDVSGYDEHIEGVEADETASLDTPIAEVGFY